MAGAVRLLYPARRMLAELWPPPAPETNPVRRDGERIAANFRMTAAACGGILPLAHILFQRADLEPWVGLAASVFVFGVSWLIKRTARRAHPPPLLGFASTIFDVTLVSAIHVAFIAGGQPFAAVCGRVYFGAYFLVIMLSCLRLDTRVSLLAGIMAVAEYGAIVAWASRAIAASGIRVHPNYGAFRWDNQVSRVVLLTIATATAIVVVRQSRKLLTASLHDSLTGLPNRHYALVRLDDTLAAARRSRRQVVIALADIDHFKAVNDHYGHAVGDDVLTEVGAALRAFCREMDVVARYGGEEFLLIFTESNLAGAVSRLTQLTSLNVHPVHQRRPRELRVTFSIGVASWPEDGETAGTLIEVADRRLYQAKDAGRGRVEAREVVLVEKLGA